MVFPCLSFLVFSPSAYQHTKPEGKKKKKNIHKPPLAKDGEGDGVGGGVGKPTNLPLSPPFLFVSVVAILFIGMLVGILGFVLVV